MGSESTDAPPIRFQRLYLDIEKVRFPNRLRVETDIPGVLASALVPPLLLQPIVENAIKHGVARSSEPVTVSISAREEKWKLILTVENDGKPADSAHDGRGTGVGMINVCDRLVARYGERGDCDHGPLPGGGYRVTVSLPVEIAARPQPRKPRTPLRGRRKEKAVADGI